MTTHPAEQVWLIGSDVEKLDVQSYFRAYTHLDLDTADALRAMVTDGQESVWLRDLQAFYEVDLNDTTSPDDGDAVIVSADPHRYKKQPIGGGGEGIQIDAVDLLANRPLYDAELEGFNFVASDTSEMYVKQSDALADWSAAIPILSRPAVVTGSSATSLAIGLGSRVFATQTAVGWTVGQRLRAASAADGANFMSGLVTAYAGGTLTLDVDLVGGAGTHADWNISIDGEQGIPGEEGPPGPQGNSFSPDAVVPDLPGRAAYDDEPANFACLVEADSSNSNLPTLYFKLSATTADWSNGFTFMGTGGGGGVVGVATFSNRYAQRRN